MVQLIAKVNRGLVKKGERYSIAYDYPGGMVLVEVALGNNGRSTQVLYKNQYQAVAVIIRSTKKHK